jgi:Tol biopolymer transport system component
MPRYVLRRGEGYLARGEPEKIASDNVWNTGAAWTPDGSKIVFSFGTAYVYGLWRAAAPTLGKPRRLAFAAEQASQPTVSRQGNRLLFQVTRSDSNIWRIDLGNADEKPGVPVKFVASTKADWMPSYSPDGTRIAFVSERSGSRKIKTFRPLAISMTVSPDGRALLYTQLDDVGSDLMPVKNFR